MKKFIILLPACLLLLGAAAALVRPVKFPSISLNGKTNTLSMGTAGVLSLDGVSGVTTTWTNTISGVITQRISTIGGLVVTNLSL